MLGVLALLHLMMVVSIFLLHITALRGAHRRPKVGDVIIYQEVVEVNGDK